MPPGNPTTFLPPLAHVTQYSPAQLLAALNHLRLLYWPLPPSPAPPKTRLHLIHDDSVPDSGYASESEDEDDGANRAAHPVPDDADLATIRADAYERTFAVQWLTGLVARSAKWLGDDDERCALLDETTALLAAFAGQDRPEEAVTRRLAFAGVEVELNDAPLTVGDHTCVGLQSWAGSIVLATRLCAAPGAAGLVGQPRVLELGAGTGLLSIVAKKLCPGAALVATDYHADVLANCARNVATNFPGPAPAVHVAAFDWEHPAYAAPLDAPFDTILAADVVYHPAHAAWLKPCVERLLARHGVFWMIVALRSTGRHEGLAEMVDEVFPSAEAVRVSGGVGEALAVVRTEVFARMEGVGRADEGGYKLFEMGWVR
ncbi:hypothetical protein HWV62_15875 [Athelia sp. TMB]|nr:hypothetical protein HWV62_15875 [Athelia sp. TMB]